MPRGQGHKVKHVPLAPVAQEWLAGMLLEGPSQALHKQDIGRMRAFIAEHPFGHGPERVSQRGPCLLACVEERRNGPRGRYAGRHGHGSCFTVAQDVPEPQLLQSWVLRTDDKAVLMGEGIDVDERGIGHG